MDLEDPEAEDRVPGRGWGGALLSKKDLSLELGEVRVSELAGRTLTPGAVKCALQTHSLGFWGSVRLERDEDRILGNLRSMLAGSGYVTSRYEVLGSDEEIWVETTLPGGATVVALGRELEESR